MSDLVPKNSEELNIWSGSESLNSIYSRNSRKLPFYVKGKCCEVQNCVPHKMILCLPNLEFSDQFGSTYPGLEPVWEEVKDITKQPARYLPILDVTPKETTIEIENTRIDNALLTPGRVWKK